MDAGGKRLIVDTVIAACKPQKGESLDVAVRTTYRDQLSAIDGRTADLLKTFGHLDGNEISALVEALDQRGSATVSEDREGLQILQELAVDAGDAMRLLASVMPEEGPFRPMYAIVAGEFDKVGQAFAERLGVAPDAP